MQTINMYIVGERIQKRRLELQLTQKKAAKDLGISFHYLSKIENGQGKMGLDLILRICQYLDIDIAYALTGSIYRKEVYGKNVSQKLIETYSNSSSKKQDIIEHILSTLEEI